MLLYTLNSGSVFSAPVSGIGSLSDDKNNINGFLSGFETTIRFDHQTNNLPEQIDQFMYSEPGSDEDKRHYSKTRQSENQIDMLELETGLKVKDKIFIYGKVGVGRFDSKILLLDESFKGLYQDPDLYKITDDSMLMFGGGFSVSIFSRETKKFFQRLNGHLDVQYRRLVIDADNSGRDGVSYKSDLDEIQAAIMLTGSLKNFKLFLGPRVSSITGKEELKIKKSGFNYNESIKSSENIGWVFGMSFFNNEKFSLKLQKRTGDEEGISFETNIFF
eukprot:gnl/Chilomastix_cuspidata/9105.p1 GENE.gnl/Chilomastix_cuspidata/9105~~gnl/Chilomastix_cuspidata/9105.p1  ORF type:complete len:301 (-),score=25.40 gnl/Chilomastix_cuspidata/9105:534-1358(-)